MARGALSRLAGAVQTRKCWAAGLQQCDRHPREYDHREDDSSRWREKGGEGGREEEGRERPAVGLAWKAEGACFVDRDKQGRRAGLRTRLLLPHKTSSATFVIWTIQGRRSSLHTSLAGGATRSGVIIDEAEKRHRPCSRVGADFQSARNRMSSSHPTPQVWVAPRGRIEAMVAKWAFDAHCFSRYLSNGHVA